MENKNSKITDEYKAEITSILSRISQDLGKSVTASIEPKISSFTASLESNFENTQEINKEQKANIEKAANFFSTLNDKVNTFSKNLDGNVISEKISADIKVFEQNFVKDNRSNKDEVIREIHKESSKIKELISQQKKAEIILQNLKNINSQQSVLLESFEGKANFTNENLAKIRKTIDVTNDNIEKEKLILHNAIISNSQLVEKSSKGTEEIITDLLLKVSLKISNIENDNKLELQIKDARIKQEKTDKFIYLLLFITTIVLVLAILNLFK